MAGGQSGKVSHEQYLQDTQTQLIAGVGETDWTKSSIDTSTSGANINTVLTSIFGASNPYAGAERYDPDSEISASEGRVAIVEDLADEINELTTWDSILAEAVSSVGDMYDFSDVITSETTSWNSLESAASTAVDDVVGTQAVIGTEEDEWETMLDKVKSRLTYFLEVDEDSTEMTEYWDTMLDTVISRMSDLVDEVVDVEAEIAAYDRQAEIQLARAYNRVEAGMFDINATASTAFPTGLAILEAARQSDSDMFSAQRRIAAQQQQQNNKTQIILASVGEMSRILAGNREFALRREADRLQVLLASITEMSRILTSRVQLDNNYSIEKGRLVVAATESVAGVLRMRLGQEMDQAKTRSLNIMQAVTSMSQLLGTRGQLLANAAQLRGQVGVQRIAAEDDKIMGDLALNSDEALWELSALQQAWQILGATAGVGMPSKGPTKFQSTLVGAMGGLALGVGAGILTGNVEVGIAAALIGALGGGLLGYTQGAGTPLLDMFRG